MADALITWEIWETHLNAIYLFFYTALLTFSSPIFFFNLDVVSVSRTTAPIMTALKKIPKEAKRHPWVSLDQSWESPPASGQQGAVGSSPLRARPLLKCRSGAKDADEHSLHIPNQFTNPFGFRRHDELEMMVTWS